MEVEASEMIDKPSATVFDFIGFHHVANHPRWDPRLRLEQATDGPIGIGTVVRRRSTHYGEPVDGIMECVEFDPPRAISFLINDGLGEIRGRMLVEPDGPQRSRLTISANMPRADVPMDARPLQDAARRIKDLIESER